MGRFSFTGRTGTRQALAAAACSAAALLVLACGARPAAADVMVFTSAAPAVAEQELAAAFTEATGHRVLFTVGTVREIQDKLSGSAQPDVVVLPTAALDVVDRAAGLQPGSRIDLARVGKTLLAARSIAHPDPLGGGFAGAQIARMFARLGISDLIKPKTSLAFAFTGGVAQVADGNAEIGLFNISEILPVKGVTLAGPLPPELQSYITFSAALHAGAAAGEPAAGFLRWLSGPNARDAWRMAGFELIGNDH
jgi:molybdate transport system substrate-binding protein